MKLNELMGTGISLYDYKESCRDNDSLDVLVMRLSLLTRERDFS